MVAAQGGLSVGDLPWLAFTPQKCELFKSHKKSSLHALTIIKTDATICRASVKPIECVLPAPEASCGGRESMDLTWVATPRPCPRPRHLQFIQFLPWFLHSSFSKRPEPRARLLPVLYCVR